MATITRNEDGTLEAFAWPGGYQMFYLDEEGETLCPNCAAIQHSLEECEEHGQCGEAHLIGADANYEDEDIYCVNCSGQIPASYADEHPLIDWRDTSQAMGMDACHIADPIFFV